MITGRPKSTKGGKKRCSKCKETKPLSEFWIQGSNYTNKDGTVRYQSWCKSCQALAQKNCRPTKQKAFEYHLRYKYRITPEQHSELMESHDGCCAICSEKITGRGGVDHCHTTGKVRGLLCGKCNTGLGLFRDSETLLKNAIEYLRKYQ